MSSSPAFAWPLRLAELRLSNSAMRAILQRCLAGLRGSVSLSLEVLAAALLARLSKALDLRCIRSANIFFS